MKDTKSLFEMLSNRKEKPLLICWAGRKLCGFGKLGPYPSPTMIGLSILKSEDVRTEKHASTTQLE